MLLPPSFNDHLAEKMKARPRIAFIVSHPIQYYVPLYQRLAQRSDVSIKVFFTWHDGSVPVQDHGFGSAIAWDIPLTEGYEFELVKNVAGDPGTHHFSGLRNPDLMRRVLRWNPTIVHITGWAWWSHLQAIRDFSRKGLPILFRGDSHLLDEQRTGARWSIKKFALTQIYRWPALFLVTGQANLAYYQTFEVDERKLIFCPHSIDYMRFAEPATMYEEEARRWRSELGIDPDKTVLLFAGKFEGRKRPIEFMKAVEALGNSDVIAVMVGGGELQGEVDAIAKSRPDLFRVVGVQNQRRMPVVYRLGDLFVLPSIKGETWGLAANEAMASGRPVLVTDKVGCAPDVLDEDCGYVAATNCSTSLCDAMRTATRSKAMLEKMRTAATLKARRFDISVTENTLMNAISDISVHE